LLRLELEMKRSRCCWMVVMGMALLLGLLLLACSDEQESGTDGDENRLEEENDSALEAENETAALCPALGDNIPERPFRVVENSSFYIDPYLMNTTETSTVIMWETETPCIGTLEYGTSESLGKQIHDTETRKIHELKLDGLAVNTHYYYRVTSCGTTTPVFDFYTAPPKGSPVRFAVWGDDQSHPEISSVMFRAMADRFPYFLVSVGDVVGEGHVELEWKTEFLDPLRPLGHSIPTWVATGSHEENSQHFYDHVSFPQSIPGDPGSESFYSFTYGNIFFLVIDVQKVFYDVETDPEHPKTNAISAWLRGQLASQEAKDATWRIAIGHESAFSEGWSSNCYYKGMTPVAKWLWPKLAANHFHLYLAGHTHGYERGLKDGVVQIITGGGGGDLDQWCHDFPETTVTRYIHHYLAIESGCETLKISAYALDNQETPFDTLTLDKDKWGEIAEEETEGGGL